jgi:hypothetical protein
MSLEYLFSPTKQFTYPSGKLLDGGKIFVYFKDTTNLATLYSPEGSFVSNPILLDANGRASVRADVAYQYRLEIYTNKDVLLYTCEAFCEGDGSGGFGFVIHDETLSGNGTAASPLGIVNIPLAVNETMTAYEEVVEGENALVIGVNSAWLDDKLEQELAGKVDRTEFEDCCSAVNEALENKLDASAFDLSNYYNKQETNNLLDQRVDRYEFAQTMNWVDQTKQDKLEFGYDENSAISSINNSALRVIGNPGGNCPWISGNKEIASAQTLTPNMYFQALSSFDLHGDHNHFISMKGGLYRFPNEWEIGSAIAQTNYFMPQSGMSGYLSMVAFSSYTASIDNTLTANWAYTNSAYSLSLSNFYNKLDISSYSSTSGLGKFPFTGTDGDGYNYTANANSSSFELIKNKDLEIENVKFYTSGFNFIDNQSDLNVSWSSLKDIPAQLATLSSHDNAIVNSNRTEYYIGRNNRMMVTTGFSYDYAPNAPKIESYDGDIQDGWWQPAGGPCFSTNYVVTSDNIRVGGKGGYGSAYSGEYARLEFTKRGAYLVTVTTPFKITSPGTNGGQYYINFQFNVHSGEGSTYRNKLINRALVCEYADTWTLPVIITGTSGYLSVGAELRHTSAASANDGFSGVFGRMIPHAVRVGDSITSPWIMPWTV